MVILLTGIVCSYLGYELVKLVMMVIFIDGFDFKEVGKILGVRVLFIIFFLFGFGYYFSFRVCRLGKRCRIKDY